MSPMLTLGKEGLIGNSVTESSCLPIGPIHLLLLKALSSKAVILNRWSMKLFKWSTERSFRENGIFTTKCLFYRSTRVFLSFSTIGITAFVFDIILSRSRAVERGGKGHSILRPGLLQRARAVVKRNANWFWLPHVLYCFWYLDWFRKFPIDTEIENSKWLSLIFKKERSSLANRCVCGCFAWCCRQFQPRSFSGKIFRLFSQLSKFCLKFCQNRVTSQVNFKGSGEGPILEWSGGITREHFAKLHLKIRIFVHSGSQFLYNVFTRLIRRMKS